MIIKSQFRWTVGCALLALLFLAAVMMGAWYLLVLALEPGLLLRSILAVIVLLPVAAQIRFIGPLHKAVAFQLTRDEIVVRPYWGFGSARVFQYSDFYGYSSQMVYQKGFGMLEYSYLVCAAGSSYGFSQFYHRNYSELKAALDLRIPVLTPPDAP